jgi:hypothetical protein
VRRQLAPRHALGHAGARRALGAKRASEHRLGHQILRDPEHTRGDDLLAPALELAARLLIRHVAVDRASAVA